MKKVNSIFFKIGLFITPVVLLLDVMVLLLSYNTTYNSNLKIFEKQIRNAAEITVQYCETYNLYDNLDPNNEEEREEFDEICKAFDITYAFVVNLDLEKNTETYLAIGFGEDASQAAKDTRYPGVTVKGMINEAEIKAYNGDPDGEILHERNTFGESLTCYWPCTRYYDSSSGEYIKYDHPLIVGTEITLDAVINSVQEQFGGIAVVTVALTLVIVVSFGVILYFKVSKPVRRISRRMSEYVTNREKEKHSKKMTVKGNDEFSLMVHSFNTMTDEIDRYLDDIETLTRDKHTQEAELNIARGIQMGLLLPDHVDSSWYGIEAFIKPAKDVGGDLYDYCETSDGKIFTVIADVSGKGISAALFMSRAVTLLHQYALAGFTPSRILEFFNHMLCMRNSGGLFITTFVAIYDPTTGIMTYSNAGHNYPYLLSDKLIPLTEAHGIAAGLFDGEKYEDARIIVAPESMLFMYTDGVNEAKNTAGGFYSTERLEEKLTACIESGSEDVLNDILSDLNSFTLGAEQNDDITMLTLYIKPRPDDIVLHLTSDVTLLPKIKETVFALDADEDQKRTIFLAVEEIFVNICSYAYDVSGDVEIRIFSEDNGIGLTFTDGGKPFDPTCEVLQIEDYDHDHAVGGLGRYLAFAVADRYHYEYADEKNILYLFFGTANEVKKDDDHEKT